MAKPTSLNPPRAWPWATTAVALAACVATSSQAAQEVLLLDRAAVFAGQWWRLWSGHVTHLTLGHLFWNLAVFLAAGVWLERMQPRVTRWFLAFAPPVISGALLMLDSTLERYAGLSGVAAGLIVLLACDRLKTPAEPRWLWIGVLAAVAAKVAVEWWTGAPLLASALRPVPLAHCAGAACGVAAFFTGRLKN